MTLPLKLIFAAALLVTATPAFAADDHAAPVGNHQTNLTDETLPTIETTLGDEDVSGTETHTHDSQDMFDETAPTAEEPAHAE